MSGTLLTNIYVNPDIRVATYTAAWSATLAIAPTDVVVLQGSDSRVIRVKKMVLAPSASTQSALAISLYRRSTANTGGTSTALSPQPHNPNDAPSTAGAVVYSANASSLGTGVLMDRTYMPAQLFSVAPAWIQTWGPVYGVQPIALVGSGQWFAINLEGVGLGAFGFRGALTWTEE